MNKLILTAIMATTIILSLLIISVVFVLFNGYPVSRSGTALGDVLPSDRIERQASPLRGSSDAETNEDVELIQ